MRTKSSAPLRTCLTALPLIMGVSAFEAHADYAIEDDPFSDLEMIPLQELQEMRGGYSLGPFDAKIGLEISTIADDIKVKTSISTDVGGLVDEITSEVFKIVDQVKGDAASAVNDATADAGAADGFTNSQGQGLGTVADGSTSFTLKQPGVDFEGTIGDDPETPLVPVIELPAFDKGDPTEIEVPTTIITPITIAVDEVSDTVDANDSTGDTTIGLISHGSVDPATDVEGDTQNEDAGVTLSSSGTSSVVEIPNNDGITKIVQDAVNGHRTLIENDANNVSISQTYSINLHLLNFDAITSMARARQINSAIHTHNLHGLLR